MKFNKANQIFFWLLFFVVAVYYGVRMFSLTPWYDELYTYYFFISKGPIYAAIHWPLPNNHMGYSVLSGFLNYFGNSYIGLRGISYLSALLNMILIKKISHHFFDRFLSNIVVVCYVCLYLVNQQSIQGRGYTLGITCFLATLAMLCCICKNASIHKFIYPGFAVITAYALYTVSSNIYFVIPLCITGCIYLFLIRNKKEGFQNRWKTFMLWCIIAAVLTIVIYAMVWAAIGSNLLIKDNSSVYFGMDHIKMLLKSPFDAIVRGFSYMVDTPYIQSEARSGFTGRLLQFFMDLSGYFLPKTKYLFLLILLFSMAIFAVQIIQAIQRKQELPLLKLFLLLELIFIPICLWIQCKRPYFRVFTYLGVLFVLCLGTLLFELFTLHYKKLTVFFSALLSILCIYNFFLGGYFDQYGEREHALFEAYQNTASTEQNPCVTDCNQEYMYYFLYGIRCENKDITQTDYLILDQRMKDPSFKDMVWEWYIDKNTIPWDTVKQMNLTYQNKYYDVYIKNEGGIKDEK